MDASACVPLYSRRQQHALGFLLGHGVRGDMSAGIERRVSCGMSGVSFFQIAMWDVPR